MLTTTLLAATLDHAIDAILVTDANLAAPGPRIAYANPAFTALTGYAAHELVGQSPRVLQGAGTDRAVLARLRDDLGRGRTFVGNAVNYRKDGTPFDIEWRVSPIVVDGEVVQYLSIHRDVTLANSFAQQTEQYIHALRNEQQRLSGRQAELELANAKLQQLAMTDGLTGVFNRRHLHERLASAGEYSVESSLLMIDVDLFKSFNDAFGHPAGDVVLQEVADVARRMAGPAHAVARYGGEEFAVLMTGAGADEALATAERIREGVEALVRAERAVTVSIGVSTLPGGGTAGPALLKEADAALYAAKAAGRNRIVHQRDRSRATPQTVPSMQATQASSCGKPCAPSPTGCLRCESIPRSKAGTGAALLLGPQDADASNALAAVLAEAQIHCEVVGPVLIIHDARERLADLGALFKARLSPSVQGSIVAAHVPGGLDGVEKILGALMTARPLDSLLRTLEHEWVRDALNDGWLFSVFHPIVNSRTGKLFAQEALLRARNPASGKIIGAGQIISACEQLNLQHQLDQRARQTAIRGAAEHVARTSKVFINFLPNTIYDPAVCLRTTMEAAALYGVAMDRLVFEVVETEQIHDMDHLKSILQYYRDRGVGTAIDDMGAGFTSLDYITALKPNFVKLDREFVLSAVESSTALAQLDRIVRLSHEHGALVIAEGIETETQMDLCVRADVDLLQGFLFAKPACPPQVAIFPAVQRRVA